MSTPLVSVIMITYNRAHFIGEAITSVIDQSDADIELLIVDDGSSDNTEEVVKKFDHNKIRYFRLPHTGWGSQLRNYGLKEAKGQFIGFIDSDDVWQKEKIRMQLHALSTLDNQPGFVFTDIVEFSDENTILKNGMYNKLPSKVEKHLFSHYVRNFFAIYPSTMLFDKRCLEHVGHLNERYPWTDNEFFHRLAYHYQGVLIREPLVRIRKHSSNTSDRHGHATVNEMLDMLERFYSDNMIRWHVLRSMSSFYCYMRGLLYLKENQSRSARKAFFQAAVYNPFYLKAYVRIIMTFFGSGSA